ncbi:restriction endonuclease subunit S (plasmid) [Priestia aryabhattai]
MIKSYFMENLLDGVEVEWKALGDITLPTSNIRWKDTKGTYRYIDLTSVSRENNKIIETTEISAENAPSRARKLVVKDDVIFATTRPTQQRLCLITEEFSGEVASTGYCILRAKKDEVLPEWIYYCITSSDFKNYVEENQSGSAYPAISDAKVKEFKIPIPSFKVQKEIVYILDTFSELTSELTLELTLELTARKKQYNYYRDKLLTFEEDNVEKKRLGDVGEFIYGYAAKAKDHGDARFIRITDINMNGKLIPTDAKFIDISKENERFILKKNDLLMARTGATFGKTMIFEEDYPAIFAGFLIKLSLDNKIINPKYYWHFSQSELFWEQANKLVSGGGQPQFNANAIKKVKIPIPYPDNPDKSLMEQARIVSILDKFDTLIFSITEGLRREIELHQKQYECYRDMVLSSLKKEVEE